MKDTTILLTMFVPLGLIGFWKPSDFIRNGPLRTLRPSMEDGASTTNTSATFSANFMDVNLMDELLFDGFWLETTTDDSNFWQPGPLTPSALDSSPYYSLTSDINIDHLNSNLHDTSISEEAKTSDFIYNKSLLHTQMDEFVSRQTENQEAVHSASSSQAESFLVQGTEMNRRLWIGPNTDPIPSISVRKRMVQAIEYLKNSTREKNVLIQIWVPTKRGGRRILTTKNQPFSLDPNCKSLAEYRHVSRNYQFAAEEDSKEFVGLPGRVFLKKLPEWTPDVRFFKGEEYSRVHDAQQYNIRGSIALPVFERGSGTCLGVVEIVSTAQKVNYRPELENIRKALEAVDLSSSNISLAPEAKDYKEFCQVAVAEIQSVLRCVCDVHKLPLAQTWAPCSQQGRGGCRHSDENYAHCISTIDSACYVRDPQVMDFHVACSEHHLLKGEGVPGRAFTSNQPCFATDITAFSKAEYPLSHHAKVFGLRACVAIRLRTIHTGSADFVLEFFLPLDCKDAEDQKQVLNSLSSVLQQISHSLRVVSDQELREEATFPDDEMPGSPICSLHKEKSSSLVSPSEKPSLNASSWASSRVDDSRKGKGIFFSLDNHEEDLEQEFKLTTRWDNSKLELHHTPTFPEHTQIQQGLRLKGPSLGSEDISSIEEYNYTGSKAGERKKKKTEKTISLQVLRQYFSGSLKDAAKSIGVCPTTLKRICRQHGITRWPSRKIKKVGHSLRKLQLVIDSVQGAEGAIQLNSFYSNFPELNSANLATPSKSSVSKRSDHLQILSNQPEGGIISPKTTASKSSSSSGSHSSSSSFSCSAGVMQSLSVHLPSAEDASSAGQCGVTLKRAYSDAELHDLVDKETKPLVRSQSQRILGGDVSPGALPPLPQNSTWISPGGRTFRVKVSFGEEKIRLSLQPHWGFGDLLQEVRRRFNIDDTIKIDLKYLDDDSEWVLLTCDADLEECIDIYMSSKSNTIKMSVHQPNQLNLGSSCASHGAS